MEADQIEVFSQNLSKFRDSRQKIPKLVFAQFAVFKYMTPCSPVSLRRAGRFSHWSQASHLAHLTSPFLSGRVELEGSVMSKQIAFLLTGLTLAISSTGCCCLSGLGGYNRCQPCGGCPTGGGGYYPPQTTMMQTIDQTAYSSGYTQTAAVNGAVIGAPIIASPSPYTQTVVVPTNSLPPY